MGIGLEPYADKSYCLRGTIAENVVGTSSGQWFFVEGYEKKSIDIRIAGTASVQVCVSNYIGDPANDEDGQPIPPANSDDGIAFETALSASGLVEMKSPVRWIKVKVVSGSGTVNAWMQGCP